jgi:hypothetical protein
MSDELYTNFNDATGGETVEVRDGQHLWYVIFEDGSRMVRSRYRENTWVPLDKEAVNPYA